LTSDDDERAWVVVVVVAAAADPSYGWIYFYQTKPENEISLLIEVFFFVCVLVLFVCWFVGLFVVVVEVLILVCVFFDAHCHGSHYC